MNAPYDMFGNNQLIADSFGTPRDAPTNNTHNQTVPYRFNCGVPGCPHPCFTRVTESQMRLPKHYKWQNRCKKHTPRWLRELVYAENRKALERGKLTLELAAWTRENTIIENMPCKDFNALINLYTIALMEYQQ